MRKWMLLATLCYLIIQPVLALAGYEEGYLAAQKGLYPQALAEFKKAAEKGDKRAEYSLAVMYNDGIGTKRQPKEALYWFQKAAEHGHPIARQILDAKSLEQRDTRPKKQAPK